MVSRAAAVKKEIRDFPPHRGECPELLLFRDFRASIERAEAESEVEAVGADRVPFTIEIIANDRPDEELRAIQATAAADNAPLPDTDGA